MNSTLLWTGPGIYEPLPILDQTEWWRNDDGQPFVGVQVDSIENARKFAAVKEFMLPLALTMDGQIQRMIDVGQILTELEDDMADRQFWSKGQW